ncbi:N-acetylglutaminylglutamine synthetase [Denitromonas iodatirespirans]|uniref:N-acetylglutaminylglutamine synthetase n=1 Tax=Denitromonas iodatirespirans TaxID=2795389 RepID=A0A944H990_DENI1|nr:N-acetylglutaminylglutamine synthetase [Denitromonas iodatirespirans]MBT0963158.1 N-acetylglutaminylglutamine synthetase [Denitromonas iodatirespirans]
MIRKHVTRALRPGSQPLHLSAGQPDYRDMPANGVVECGWGRWLPAQTYTTPGELAAALLEERPGQRDIAFYVARPHVVVAQAPQQLFVDPSETFRLGLGGYRPQRAGRRGFTLRRLRTRSDVAAINALYGSRKMVPVEPQRVWRQRAERHITWALAEDRHSGEIIGVAMGLDHVEAFADPQAGSSLWSLAVAPQAAHPGVGEALVRYLAEHFQARGRAWMDVSVMHDNAQAIALYEKLGFQRISVFAVKRRNAINEPFYTQPVEKEADLNPYARLITDEARKRGIHVEVLDAANGYFRLSLGGRSLVCRESLTELTSAIAMSRCQDKRVTLRLLAEAGLKVPAQRVADGSPADAEFLAAQGAVVVKPVEGEQGKGISVNITTTDELTAAIERARHFCDRVLIEAFCPGQDLRIVVIDFQVVAAAVRRPPMVVGDGVSTIRALIEKQSRRRQAATDGESSIPMDAETQRCVAGRGYALDDVLSAETELTVRNTANLHTGGTIHDVTDSLHPVLRRDAEAAARALDIPVTGLDFIVPDPAEAEYVIIEANERPGLANHEPQPTAERFIDLLFPRTRAQPHQGER